MSGDLDLFAGDGLSIENFGMTEDGRPFVVASHFARAMGYRDAERATRLLDEDERGTQIVGTSERSGRVANRPVSVIYEDGIWELIFRSTLPSAKSVKTKVKAILRQLRETGVVDTRQRPMTELEMARKYVAALERIERLEPSAQAWDQLAAGSTDYAVSDAAKILCRDPGISIGRDRLFAYLFEQGWIYRGEDNRYRAYQRPVDAGWLTERLQSSLDSDGVRVGRAPQIRVTVKGLHALHQRLGGTGPVLREVTS